MKYYIDKVDLGMYFKTDETEAWSSKPELYNGWVGVSWSLFSYIRTGQLEEISEDEAFLLEV